MRHEIPTRLFVEAGAEDVTPQRPGPIAAADGVVLDREAMLALHNRVEDAARSASSWVLRRAEPRELDGWCGRPNVRWVGEGTLEAIARRRDAWPRLQWIPRVEVESAEVRFAFRKTSPGEGFSFYVPDTAAIQGYRVTESQGGSAIETWLVQVADFGFDTVWLHTPDAAAAGRGLDLDLLHRARRCSPAELWLSGGATGTRHLANLAGEGGAAAVVLPLAVVDACGCAAALAALGRPAKGEDDKALRPGGATTVFDISERIAGPAERRPRRAAK